ncbi:MAG: hypothetical protein D4S01_10395 [Dehalococcoidia bacterium]|nr:MAG: hypothetical protein D4S01_10395 [Dehalococcoidia bacterium]
MSNTYETFNSSTFKNLSPEKQGEAMAAILSTFVNGIQKDSSDAFVRAITNNHRTLQQLTFDLFLKLVKDWAKIGDDGEFYYDARNEFTVLMSQKIREVFEEKYGTNPLSAPFI